jgi:hypothetical protein
MIQGEVMMMTREQLLERDTVLLVLEANTEMERQQQINDYLERCRQLKIKTEATKLVTACKKDLKEQQKQLVVNNTTHFDYEGGELNCGMWIADKSGVKAFSDKGGYKLACYHPILPIERLFNLETRTEKIRLAYFRDNRWRDIVVDKDLIASNSKIVKLSAYGVAVTTESSKNLVSYLADVENLNQITISKSTSKLGWIDGGFIPYDDNVKFDDESRFKDLIDSIGARGSEEAWIETIKKVRANTEHYEPQMMMAASFASVLVKKMNMLPFIVNLWGKTGGGKTVSLMLACSIWADPSEGRYITDSYATQNAFEVRLDILNNLPLLMDDLSKVRDKLNDGFTDLIYLLCSGKGKERSNIDLGLNKSKTWSNIILSNMERPLATETMRGGAINRIIDVEMAGGDIYDNGNAMAEFAKENYGFAGPKFVDLVKDLPVEVLTKTRKDFERKIKAEAEAQGSVKEEKQILPLSLILTADKLATELFFEDGIYLDIPTMVRQLKDVEDVSEGKRAYETILDYSIMYKSKFSESEYAPESWGLIKDGYINIVPAAMRRIAQEQNFSVKAFCAWAKDHLVLRTNNKKNQFVMKVGDNFQRFYSVKQELIEEISGFETITEAIEEEIPFD